MMKEKKIASAPGSLLLIHRAAAEIIGTFVIVFSGCGSIMVYERFPDSISPHSIPFIFGLAVMAMVYSLGHISGAHFNPSVTLAFSLTRNFPKKDMVIYWLSQCIGAMLALFCLFVLLPHGATFGATVPMLSPFASIVWEAILTFFLMFVVISIATDTRAIGSMAGVAIGVTVMICAYFGGPVTGASMNPARSLAPAIFQNTLNSFWIYVIGPSIGAVFAAYLYEWIRSDSQLRIVETNKSQPTITTPINERV